MPFPKNSVPGGNGGRIKETIKPGIDGLDAAVEPFGMYSGMTKRLARSDGAFVRIQNGPNKDERD